MTPIKLLLAPIRRIVSFPLFQLVVANALDWLVEQTVRLCAAIFEVKSFTRSWLTTGFMIAYVYLAGVLILLVAKDRGRHRGCGAQERIRLDQCDCARARDCRLSGVAAAQAIRPAEIPQAVWEERFAWPADDRPPYPPLSHRILRAVVIYLVFALVLAALLQAFTPFPALTWLGRLIGIP